MMMVMTGNNMTGQIRANDKKIEELTSLKKRSTQLKERRRKGKNVRKKWAK